MQYDTFSDEELIAMLRKGEDDITDYILEKYKPLVRKRTNAMYLMRARMSIHQKYMPFPGHDITFSEWRGATVLFISVFLIFYLSLALLLSYALLRWVLPRKWRGSDFKLRLRMLNNVVGIALFAIIVMIVRATSDRNFIQMGTGLIINMAWLLEAIFLSPKALLEAEDAP